jgi:hypothetical protein
VSTSNKLKKIEFGGPAMYRIVVQGVLSEVSRRRVAGMTIESTQGGEKEAPRTILIGHVRDQAELRGVLDTLYGLHLPVITVEQCNDASKQNR